MKRQEIIESIQNVYNSLARIAQEQLGDMVCVENLGESPFYGVFPREMVVDVRDALQVYEDGAAGLIDVRVAPMTDSNFTLDDMKRIMAFIDEVGDPDVTVMSDGAGTGAGTHSELHILLTSDYCFEKFG